MLRPFTKKDKSLIYFTFTIIELAICKAVVRELRSVDDSSVSPEQLL
jgi:hypothetical protein